MPGLMAIDGIEVHVVGRPFDERFNINLDVAKAREDVEEIFEDRRWPRQVWTSLPEKF